MGETQENICCLCLKYEGGTFSPLDESSKENLKVVVPEINLDAVNNSDICSNCKDSLEESCKLKKISSETDQFIRTQRDELKITDKVNLNSIVKISTEANGDANSESADKKNICRICLKDKEVNYMSINTAKTDNLFTTALEECLPELDWELTTDPVICELCHSTLRDMYSFKIGRLSVKEKLKRYCETTSETEVNLQKVLSFLKAESKKCLGEDNFLSEFEVQDEEEADIFDIFPSFSGDGDKNNDSNRKRSITEESLDKPTKKQKSVGEEPLAEDELPHFSFNFNLIFNPKTEGTMEEWLGKVDKLKQTFGWSDYITIHKVLVKLKGMDDLYTWFSNISEIMTWNEWKKKLIQMFPASNDYYITLKRMINRKKKSFESYIDYYNSKLKLIQDMNITGEKAVSCLIGGVTDITVSCIARVGKYKTPEELLDYFKSCNDKKPSPITPVKNANKNKDTTATPTAAANDSPQSGSGKDKKGDKRKIIKCYTCRKYGHTSKECWETFKGISNGTVEAKPVKPPTPNKPKLGQKQRPRPRPKRKCITCGKFGHANQVCPSLRSPVPPAPKPQPQNTKVAKQAAPKANRFASAMQKKGVNTQQNPKKAVPKTRCHNCGNYGHSQNACRRPKAANPGGYLNRPASGFRQQQQGNDRYFNRDLAYRMEEDSSKIVCFKCFRIGHDARDCSMDYSGRGFRN